MSDRYCAFTVVLEKDIKDEDGKQITDAIGMIRGVLSVTPHVADVNLHVAETRARLELKTKLWDVFNKDQIKKDV